MVLLHRFDDPEIIKYWAEGGYAVIGMGKGYSTDLSSTLCWPICLQNDVEVVPLISIRLYMDPISPFFKFSPSNSPIQVPKDTQKDGFGFWKFFKKEPELNRYLKYYFVGHCKEDTKSWILGLRKNINLQIANIFLKRVGYQSKEMEEVINS